jgi:glycosyltransferase involved in cell wall biosynthesis
MNNPLVTCVCPTTAARAGWLPKAVDCFLSQTYANREMLIATEPGHAAWYSDARIRVIQAGKMPLGAKRNFACENARGEIIAHFDDDDWSAPGRLSEQVRRLQETGLAATGYSRMRFTDGKAWWRYRDPLWPLGTSLCYRRAWWERNKFDESVHVGSDTLLIYRLQEQRQVDVIDCGDMMFAREHGGNLNKRNYGPPSFEPAEALCV